MKTFSTFLMLTFGFQVAMAQSDTLTVTTTMNPVLSSPVSTDPSISYNAEGTQSAGEVYKVNNWVDIPLTVAGAGYTLWGFSKIYGREKTPESVILALDPNDVNSMDRKVIKYYDLKAKDASDMLFYGSMPLPFLLLLDREMRSDAGKLGLLYVQSMAATGVLYTSSAMIADRFRPYTYNPEVDMGRRTGGGGKNSFFAGHPALVATATFFTAKTYSDYHPEMRNKWILYTAAGAASLATGVLRIKAGQHFISDVIVGIPVGALNGILIPHFHKVKPELASRLSFAPFYGGGRGGFSASLRF